MFVLDVPDTELPADYDWLIIIGPCGIPTVVIKESCDQCGRAEAFHAAHVREPGAA
jgi:hypothetical protein